MRNKLKNCSFLKNNESVDYFKIICTLLITIIISLLFLILLFNYFFPDWHRCEDKISDLLLVIIGIVTISLTFKEYFEYRQRTKAEVLGEYNKRYSENKHINKVVNYLVCHLAKLKAPAPSVHNVEMFLRFFEEIDLQIDKNRLDADNVEELFSYYALYLDSNTELIHALGIDDYNSNNWKRYHCFVKKMVKTKLKETKWKCLDNKWSDIEFDNGGYISINGECTDYDYAQGHIKVNGYYIDYLLAGMNEKYPNDEVLIRKNRIYIKCNDLNER